MPMTASVSRRHHSRAGSFASAESAQTAVARGSLEASCKAADESKCLERPNDRLLSPTCVGFASTGGKCTTAIRATRAQQLTPRNEFMVKVILVGYDPEAVDYSDPALPPGMNAEKIHAGVAVALKHFAERRWEADVCMIEPDATAGPAVERHLAGGDYDCVVIGAGVRLPPRLLGLLEIVINAVRKAAPG